MPTNLSFFLTKSNENISSFEFVRFVRLLHVSGSTSVVESILFWTFNSTWVCCLTKTRRLFGSVVGWHSVIECKFWIRFIEGVDPREDSSAFIWLSLDSVELVSDVQLDKLPWLDGLLLEFPFRLLTLVTKLKIGMFLTWLFCFNIQHLIFSRSDKTIAATHLPKELSPSYSELTFL